MSKTNLSRPKAYSYLRFSTPDQMKGDSFRRQSQLSQAYADKHRLELDESLILHDLGVSGFRGKNVEEGRLGDFLEAVENGRVKPGSYLLVESLDRLSRQAVQRAFGRFSEILERGINIVTLQDEKVYHANEEIPFADMMYSLMVMQRAHEESLTKSRRLSAAWEGKREKAQDGKIKFTSRCPAWLELDKSTQTFNEIPECVAVVRRIFNMLIDGHGKRAITHRFNEEGVPTFGRSTGWHDSYIQKIAENEAVIGIYQPHHMKDVNGQRKRVPIGDPIEDYFPAIISKESFFKVKQMRATRATPAGRAGEKFSNLFTRIAICGHCGATMHFENKGKSSKGGTYLVCSNARRKAGNCKRHSWTYPKAQAHVIHNLTELNFKELFPSVYKQSQSTVSQIEDEILVTEAELEKVQVAQNNLLDVLAIRPDNTALLNKLDSLANEERTAEDRLHILRSELEKEKDTLANAEDNYNRFSSALTRYIEVEKNGSEQERIDCRRKLHQLLKKTLAGITFTPSEEDGYHGTIGIYLKGTDYHRVIKVHRRQKVSDGYKVYEDDSMESVRVLDAQWPPNMDAIENGPARAGEILFGGKDPFLSGAIDSLKLKATSNS